MIQFKPYIKHSKCYPPNTITEFLAHPGGQNDLIQLAVFNHHRFAFYFWAIWLRELSKNYKKSPDLISFDWHQDLAYPADCQKDELRELNLDNEFEISFYSSYRLNPLNDNHILSAAYLDLINDVWVLCKQKSSGDAWKPEYIVDYKGRTHTIRKFENVENLQKELFASSVERMFFDIDLDYFTIENNLGFDEVFDYMDKKDIISLLSLDSGLMEWILKRTQGITIALDPKYTGGISKSLEYLELISNFWFDNSIGNRNIKWKHL